VGGALHACISVQCTHSACQKQWEERTRGRKKEGRREAGRGIEGWERDEELETLGRGVGELGGRSHRYRYSNTPESRDQSHTSISHLTRIDQPEIRERYAEVQECWLVWQYMCRCVRVCTYLSHMRFYMMLIAFITIKSSLVPLIEGLCAQI